MDESTIPHSQLRSRWASDVDPGNVLPAYPRPMLVRPEWTNLNGEWGFHVTPKGSTGETRPDAFDETILVPFCGESALSGIGRVIPNDRWSWYRRTFARPEGERVLLHFGAVDWRCRVWVDGTEVGSHEGAYDPFHFDVTDALRAGTDEHEIVVGIFDPCDSGGQPAGKQVCSPEGIHYIPCAGIWGTVWAEGVPAARIDGVRITPRLGASSVELRVDATTDEPVEVVVRAGGEEIARQRAAANETFSVALATPRLWSPDDPFLYDLELSLASGDTVGSYFGMREVGIVEDAQGRPRIGLNGQPIFLLGPLDQGYWPESNLTAPTVEALRSDIELAQRLGFNTIRKHVKVEPAIWYAMCDRMGMLVWQDMPNSGAHIDPDEPDLERPAREREIFEREMRAMIDGLHNHPSIVAWTVFNEGWGQYDTERVVTEMGAYDPTRINVGVSGWVDRGVGDVHDAHNYPEPSSPDPEPARDGKPARAATLGEFGGLGLATVGHMWKPHFWGYECYGSKDEMTTRFEHLFEQLAGLVADPGLSAAIYTQTTDVETECNGLISYDRAVVKFDEARVRAAVERVLSVPL